MYHSINEKSEQGLLLPKMFGLNETFPPYKTVRRNCFWFLIFFSLFLSINTEAVELYSFFNKQCRELTGYLISEKNNVYDILSVGGKIISLHRDDLKGVLVYNFVNPPLKKIKLKKNKLEKVITLSIQSEDELDVFSGFPLQFIEDLVVFLGIDGSVRVHKPLELQTSFIHNIS